METSTIDGEGPKDYYESDAWVQEAFKQEKINEAKAEIAYIMKCLKKMNPLRRGANILDCPAGPGHHAHVLQTQGFNVTALERSRGLVEAGRKAYPDVHFLENTFHDLSNESVMKNESQDAVMCLGESFGYEETVQGNLDHLQNMYKKVKPGGALVFAWPFTPGHVNPSLDAQPLDDAAGPGKYVLPVDAADPMEKKIPRTIDIPEEFRALEVECYCLIDDQRRRYITKQANYLRVQTDRKKKPTDAPILRGLCKTIGIANKNVVFATPQRNGTKYECAMIIRKPNTVEERQKGVLRRLMQLLGV